MFYFVYIVRCADQTLYCGITTDVKRRIAEHNTSLKGSKYIRSRRPIDLVYQKKCRNRSDALRYEVKIKSLPKEKKEALVTPFQKLLTKKAKVV